MTQRAGTSLTPHGLWRSVAFIGLVLALPAWAESPASCSICLGQKLTGQILSELEQNHYRKVTLDDRFSRALMDHYLETLDPARTVFLRTDIDEFERSALLMDDQLRANRADTAELIIERYRQRSKDLLNYTLGGFERYRQPYAGKPAEIEIDRESAPWPATLAESRDQWDRRIYNELLVIRLSGDGDGKDPLDTLRKRYQNRLKKLDALQGDESYELYVNTVLDLYDPHTEWFTPQNEENFKINMSLSLEGIGAVLQLEDERTKIVRLVTGGPAAKSGAIKAGDFILAVGQGKNGEMEDVTGQRLDEVVSKIRGSKGSVVKLQIENGTTRAIKVIELVREQIKLEDQAAKSRVIENVNGQKNLRIGVINVPAFYLDFEAYQRGDEDYRSTTRDVEKLLRDLMRQKVDGVVIDLRNNGGGSLQEARLLTNLFISQGPIVQIRASNNQIDRSLRAEQDALYLGPLLVLTNRLSASASEIFAGAIQDYQRGLVVGETTFGKGTVQTIVTLDRGQLKYTNAKFYRVSGESTQHRGVIPDIATPSLFDFDEVGESSLDHVLPWDSIHEISHGHYNEIQPYLEILSGNHKARMSRDPEYQLLIKKVAFRDKRKNQKVLSIDEGVRTRQRDEENAWLLRVTNEMRKNRGLSEFADVKELEKYEEERAAELNGATIIDPENDFLLREAAAILGDFVDLKIKASGSSLATRP